MTSQVLYRKWRPQIFADVVGQEPITRTLLNALVSNRVAHAYLFFGPRGTGKTSTGRILAKAINCLQNETGEPCNSCISCQAFAQGRAIDLIEIDAASNTGVDDIRDLKEKINFAPNISKYKVYIIDEVHMLSTSAFNALLKTLEEPPGHVIFILASTEVHKVPATIISRCQRFDFRRIPHTAVVKRLEQICHHEGFKANTEALTLVAKSATGSLRDAENLLEKMVVYHGPSVELEQVRSELGLTGDARIKELAKAILSKDITEGLRIINGVAEDGLELRQFNRELVECLRSIMLVKSGAGHVIGLAPEELDEISLLATQSSLREIYQATKQFAQIDFRFSPQSTLPLELALVDYTQTDIEGSSQPKEVMVRHPEVSAPRQVPATKTAPAPPPASELKLPADSSGIDDIRGRWNDFIKACRGAEGNLDALLRQACEPISIENGDTLVLGFYEKCKFQKSKVEDPRYIRMLTSKLKDVFGVDYQVRCSQIGEENRPPPPSPRESHLVREALNHGARIISEE